MQRREARKAPGSVPDRRPPGACGPTSRNCTTVIGGTHGGASGTNPSRRKIPTFECRCGHALTDSWSLEPPNPVTRAPSVVSDCENANDGRKLDKRDRVRKPSSWGATNRELTSHPRIERKPAWGTSNRCDYSVDLSEEF